MATKTIKVTDDRQGATFRTGVNGRFFDLPLNQEIAVDPSLVDHLTSIGCRFEEVDAKRASSSKEGSGDGLAPTGPHDVRAPGTDAKSLNDRPLAGDQPGDVTEGGVQYGSTGAGFGGSIEEDAKVSDIRVAAERKAADDAPVAEKAGEGEQGTPTAKPQSVKPSHKETDAERKAKKAK
jgi:hypothetical protein